MPIIFRLLIYFSIWDNYGIFQNQNEAQRRELEELKGKLAKEKGRGLLVIDEIQAALDRCRQTQSTSFPEAASNDISSAFYDSQLSTQTESSTSIETVLYHQLHADHLSQRAASSNTFNNIECHPSYRHPQARLSSAACNILPLAKMHHVFGQETRPDQPFTPIHLSWLLSAVLTGLRNTNLSIRQNSAHVVGVLGTARRMVAARCCPVKRLGLT